MISPISRGRIITLQGSPRKDFGATGDMKDLDHLISRCEVERAMHKAASRVEGHLEFSDYLFHSYMAHNFEHMLRDLRNQKRHWQELDR